MTDKPKARTATELSFAASLLPCPHCGTTEQGQLDLFGGGENWGVRGTCRTARSPDSHLAGRRRSVECARPIRAARGRAAIDDHPRRPVPRRVRPPAAIRSASPMACRSTSGIRRWPRSTARSRVCTSCRSSCRQRRPTPSPAMSSHPRMATLRASGCSGPGSKASGSLEREVKLFAADMPRIAASRRPRPRTGRCDRSRIARRPRSLGQGRSHGSGTPRRQARRCHRAATRRGRLSARGFDGAVRPITPRVRDDGQRASRCLRRRRQLHLAPPRTSDHRRLHVHGVHVRVRTVHGHEDRQVLVRRRQPRSQRVARRHRREHPLRSRDVRQHVVRRRASRAARFAMQICG